MNRMRPLVPFMATLIALAVRPTSAQPDVQLWANATINWVKSDRLVYELDVEPKALLVMPEGEPDCRNLDVTPNVEYSPNGWLDLVGETVTGYTKQTDDVNSFEVSPRVGVRLHFLSRDLPTAVRTRERTPSRRIVVRDLVRVEFRNLFYTGAGSGTDSAVRFRNRLEFLVPLNRRKVSDDGARYLLADWEVYLPLNDVEERFANKQRAGSALDTAGALPGGSRRSTCGRNRATPSRKGSRPRRTSSTSV